MERMLRGPKRRRYPMLRTTHRRSLYVFATLRRASRLVPVTKNSMKARHQSHGRHELTQALEIFSAPPNITFLCYIRCSVHVVILGHVVTDLQKNHASRSGERSLLSNFVEFLGAKRA